MTSQTNHAIATGAVFRGSVVAGKMAIGAGRELHHTPKFAHCFAGGASGRSTLGFSTTDSVSLGYKSIFWKGNNCGFWSAQRAASPLSGL